MFTTRDDCALQLSSQKSISSDSREQPGNAASRLLNSIGQNLLRGIYERKGGVTAFASIASHVHVAVPKLEMRTGTEFPGTFCHISKEDCPMLIGTGYTLFIFS